jgi:ASC-1-like (ASCH) protein
LVHVAVLLQPYLELILQGKKTVESRLTIQARDPYDNICKGDRIYFKQSSGPYRAAAIADHVLFEDNLTPRRIKEIHREYNHLICGEDSFWHWKRNSKFCTLIWLRDVHPIDVGPAIRPLQGVAWLSLENDPAWRRVDRADGQSHANHSFLIEVTSGNLRNNSLYSSKVIDRFPPWSIGGRDKSKAARPITLVFHQGPTVQTDIVGDRKLFRTRAWGKWFDEHSVSPGDHVVFTPVGRSTFWVGLSRAPARASASAPRT